jgi:nitrate reductase NapAB chaperone NapD
MSDFIVTFDTSMQREVLDELKRIRGVVVAGKPQRNGTLKVRTSTRHLDDETEALRSIEDIPGIIDVRLL